MVGVKGLRLPSAYVEVTDSEMEYLDGEGWLGIIAIGLGVVSTICAVVAVAATAGAAAPAVIPAYVGVLTNVSLCAGFLGTLFGISDLVY